MVYFRLSWQKTICLNIRYHVGGDDNAGRLLENGRNYLGKTPSAATDGLWWLGRKEYFTWPYFSSLEPALCSSPLSKCMSLVISRPHLHCQSCDISVHRPLSFTVGGLHGRWPLFNAIARMKWCLISSQNILQPHGYGNKLNDKKCKILRTEALLRFWSKSTQFLVPAEFGYCTPCLLFSCDSGNVRFVNESVSWVNESFGAICEPNRSQQFLSEQLVDYLNREKTFFNIRVCWKHLYLI